MSPIPTHHTRRIAVWSGRVLLVTALMTAAFAVAAPAQASSSVVWSNRGTASDGFDTVFGPGAPAAAARAVVDAAIDSWERVITDFNRLDGTNDLQLTISMDPTDDGCGGSAGTAIGPDGKPASTGSSITILKCDQDTNGSSDWFVDPTPNENSEFAVTITNAFAGDGGPGADLYTLVVLEMTHIMGITNAAASRFQTGLFNSPTGTPDDAEGGSVGTFWLFQGPSINALMTSNNGGSGGSDFGVSVHTAGPRPSNAPLLFATKTVYGSEDSGNAIFEGGRRYLVSNKDALILKDAYDYDIVMPETFGTFYSVLNQTTGQLLVRGGRDGTVINGVNQGASNDFISVTREGDKIVVSVDVGDDVAGTGPGIAVNDPQDAFVTVYNSGQVQSISIPAGDGNDTITIGAGLGIPLTADGQGGNDTLDGGDVVLLGGPGDDFLYGSDLNDTLDGGADNDTLYGRDGHDILIGGAGNDIIYAGTGNNAVTDGTGNDFVDLTENSAPLTMIAQGGNDTILGSGFDDVITTLSGTDRIEGRGGNDTLTGATGIDTLLGQDGSDTFLWDEGDGVDVIEGGAGESDAIEINAVIEDVVVDTDGSTRVRVTSGPTALSLGSIEDVRVFGDAGADFFTVEDLFGTEVRKVRLEPGLGNDLVRIEGREVSELLEVSGIGGGIGVGGLAYDVRSIQQDTDKFVIDGNGGNDILMASGTSGVDSIAVAPTGLDSATLQLGGLDLEGLAVENIAVEGRGGNDSLVVTTPGGADFVTHAPGGTRDSGSVGIPGLIPITYASLGLPGSVELANIGGREDLLTVEGTSGSDATGVAPGTGVFTLNSQSPLDPSGAVEITVNGGVGDDVLGAAATLPFAETTLNGGDSVGGDKASLTGAGGGVTVDSAASTVAGYGGTVNLVSIESLATSQTGAAATSLTVLGSGTPDDMTYRPTGPQAGSVRVAGFQAALSFAGAGGVFTIDPLGDSDKVSVLGTLADDTVVGMILPLTTIQVNATKTVTIPQATAEKIAALSDEGSDLFDLTTFDSVAARLFVFGDLPSSKRFSEKMNVRNGSASKVQYRDVKAHVFENGSVFAEYRSTANTTRIDYEGVENLKFFR